MSKSKKKTKATNMPFVSICTPTFNRRPFIPMAIKCFENQTYPKEKMEWIIIDDGTDKIGDLVSHIPQVRYINCDEKLSLGKKRNMLNDAAKGDIIVYMDDDDYYPAERVKHAVTTLLNSKALCAGSSAMYIYFKHINKMYQFGPYGPNHATAATFAFKRELLKQTRFDETSCVAEEKKFLKDYTIPLVQLESKKSILVFSHNQNSFDKKQLLKQLPNPCVKEVELRPDEFVVEKDILDFFMKDIDAILEKYEPGDITNKPDVQAQLLEISKTREKTIQEQMKMQMQNKDIMDKITLLNKPKEELIQTILDRNNQLREMHLENQKMKEQINHLNNKMRELIMETIAKRKDSNA
jgi:glycosyltransferase involved in cell wall biosynthesis